MTDQVASYGDVRVLPGSVYERALEVGRRASGVSGPNPPVGCLILRDEVVIAEGATEPVGGRHAEVVALDAAGEDARGSVAVVTLEPCAHHGRTPPCVDALLSAGVGEVHVLLRDPDPAASGGLDVLETAGVRTVDVGVTHPDLAVSAAHDLRGFVSRVEHGRPHVTLKLAQTPEGATVPSAEGYLTGEEARRRVHELRAECDAVLVGGATVRIDDPRLDVRHVAAPRQPRPVVLSVLGDVPGGARVARDGSVLLHGPSAVADRIGALEAAGMRCVRVPLDERSGQLDLWSALSGLLDERILTVLAEPGVRLAGALLDARLVDRVELHVAGGAAAAELHPALPALAPLLGTSTDVERRVTSDGDLILCSDRPASSHERAALQGVA